MAVISRYFTDAQDKLESVDNLVAILQPKIFRGTVYVPTNKGDLSDIGSYGEDTVWLAMTVNDIEEKLGTDFGVLFKSPTEKYAFYSNIVQVAIASGGKVTDSGNIVLQIKDKVIKVLISYNKVRFKPYNGEFTLHRIAMPVQTSKQIVNDMHRILANWLGGSVEEADKLLDILSTALNPELCLKKYILLIGSGRNGKSTLLKMLEQLFLGNISNVRRQDIAKGASSVTMLNGKLLNLIFDGSPEFIKDNSNEKSIIVGEEIQIRKLYETDTTTVQTNALFIEALNEEPRYQDKSQAMRKRIIRFWFPNEYNEDSQFDRKMMSTPYLSALLYLIIQSLKKGHTLETLIEETDTSKKLSIEQAVNNDDFLSWFIQEYYYPDITIFYKIIYNGDVSMLNYDRIRSDYENFRTVILKATPTSSITMGKILSRYFIKGVSSARVGGVVRRVNKIVGITPLLREILTYYVEQDVKTGEHNVV
jgi:hypothetical protein